MAAACNILRAVKLHLCGKIRMAGAGQVTEVLIITGTGVGIADDSRKGRAAKGIGHHAGEELGSIRFLAGGGKRAVARGAAGQKGVELRHIHLEACGKTLCRNADGGRMGLTENGDLQIFAVSAGHIQPSLVKSAS